MRRGSVKSEKYVGPRSGMDGQVIKAQDFHIGDPYLYVLSKQCVSTAATRWRTSVTVEDRLVQ